MGKLEFEAKSVKKLEGQTTLQENQITLLKIATWQKHRRDAERERETGLRGWGIETHFWETVREDFLLSESDKSERE